MLSMFDNKKATNFT